MKLFILVSIISVTACLAAPARAQTINVGIGTTTPGSTLTFTGSMGVSYTSASSSPYNISDNDYFIEWTPNTSGTLTLPAATAIKKGRTYKLKNSNTTAGPITLNAAGGLLIDTSSSVSIPAGYSIEVIANGATSSTAWEVVSFAASSRDGSTAGASAGTIGGAGGACTPAPVAGGGTLFSGTPASGQSVDVTITATTPGTYNIATNTVNGIRYEGSGYIAATGTQTVPLYAVGTPIASGANSYIVSYGASTCSFSITTVGFNCGAAIQTQSPAVGFISGNSYSGSYTIPYTNGDGRSYGASTQTINGMTLTRVAGTYAAGGGNVVYYFGGPAAANIPAVFYIPECGSLIFGDAIRVALATVPGCSSCATYDAAAVDTWLEITSAEYAAVQGVSAIGVYGNTPAQMNQTTYGVLGSGVVTITQEYTTGNTAPASSYPVALSVRTGPYIPPANMAGMKLIISSTANNSGFANVPSSGAATPNVSGTLAANTRYYFLLKRPTYQTASSGPARLGMILPSGQQVGYNSTNSGVIFYYCYCITTSPGTSQTFGALQFQVLAATSKLW